MAPLIMLTQCHPVDHFTVFEFLTQLLLIASQNFIFLVRRGQRGALATSTSKKQRRV
jgi:hypothetical protein